MKTVVIHNVNINNFSTTDELYLSGARVTYAITKPIDHPLMPGARKRNTIFLMWDDVKFNEEKCIYDENLSPSPIHCVCDFISDIWEGSADELNHVCSIISNMNLCETIHYDMEIFSFI